MARRIVALGLWAYFGWFLTATLASVGGFPVDYAPMGGVIVGLVALIDWRSRFSAVERAEAPAPVTE